MINKQTRRELARFLFVGASTVLVDFASYKTLLLLSAPTPYAKAAGFLIGTVYAYFANRIWTFAGAETHSGSVWRFALVYGVNLCVNVAVNALVLYLLSSWTSAFIAAFIIATGTSATLNFLGMKLFVFKAFPQGQISS